MFRGDEVFEASAVADPARAAAVDRVAAGTRPGFRLRELKNTARLAMARILARPEDQRRRYVEQHMLHLWPIDSEEDEY